jgi:hypothetical protein
VNYSIVSAVHGRPHVAEAWAAHLAKHFTGPVLVAGDDMEIHDRMMKHLPGQLVWMPYCNEPLGAKWNRAAEKACDYEDHIVVLGSDDFPSAGLLWEWHEAARHKNAKFTVLDALYFYSLANRETSILTSAGVAQRGAFGTGRMYRADAFASRYAALGYAWEPWLEKGLDNSLWRVMGKPSPQVVIPQTDDVWCMAVKSDEQIWSYEHLKARCNMPVVEDLSVSMTEFLTWLHEIPGMTPRRRPTVVHN